MKHLLFLLLAALACATTQAQGAPMRAWMSDGPTVELHRVGNTSSNSSSNTSSDSGSRGSSYVHRHTWSVDSDDGNRRRVRSGSTRIERYVPGTPRYYRQRRDRYDD